MQQIEVVTQKEPNVALISIQPNVDAIGVQYLHKYLLQNNINSRVLILPNYNAKMHNEIEKFFEDYKPSIIGFSVMTENFLHLKNLITFIKLHHNNVITFMGGVHATGLPQECLEYVDYVIRGEAEDVLLDICDKIKKDENFLDTQSLVYKKDGRIIQNPLRMPERSLDKYPYGENIPPQTYVHNGRIQLLDKKLFSRYSRYNGKFYNIITSRGCNFSCTFCIESYLHKMYTEEKLSVPAIRTRSVDHVIEELKLMKSEFPDTVYLNIHDDNFFGHSIEWINEFSEKYKKEIGIPIVLRAIPIWFTEEKGRLMKDCGLVWVMTGLQTGSERIQRDMYHRYISNEQFLKCAEVIHKLKLAPYYDVIVDNPIETEQDVIETIEVLLKIPKPFQVNIMSLTFFPVTVLWDMAKENNIKFEDPYKKDFQKFKQTYLNRIIRLTPLYPKNFIRFLVNHRNHKTTRIFLPIIYYTSAYTLEPLSYLQLVYMTFRGNIKRTVKLISGFLKHYIKKQILFSGNY